LINVTNAAPTVVTPAASAESPVTVTSALLSVLGADDGGESNLTYSWSTTGTPPATVGFTGNNSNAAKNITALFSKAGTYQFLVTITDAQGSSTSSSVTVVVNQSCTSLVITPAAPMMYQNAQRQFSAAAFDQFGLSMTTPALNWSISSGAGSISSSGLYTSPGTPGSADVTISSGSVQQTTNLTIANATPTVVVPAASSESIVTGTTTNLTVLGADDGGEPNLTYTWSTTGTPAAAVGFTRNNSNAAKNITALFSKAGTYQFIVTITDAEGSSTSSGVTVVVNQSFTSLAITPAGPTIRQNAQEQFSAAAFDQFGFPMAAPAVNWSISSGGGSICSSGLYTSPGTPGSADVTVSSGSVHQTTTLAVANATPVVVIPAFPPASSSTAGTTTPPSDHSILTGIHVQTLGATSRSQSNSSAIGSAIFSPEPIDNAAVAPAPPATAPGGNSPPPNGAPAAKSVIVAQPKSITTPPAPLAVRTPPMGQSAVPDQQVKTVPDEVFAFLAPQGPMLQNLDAIKSEMGSQKAFMVEAGSATVVSLGASAAYLIWLIRGGSLLSSMLSIFPAWKSMDPLPVLESFENSRKRRRRKIDDDESLESLVEKSNQNTRTALAVREPVPETIEEMS